MKKTHLIVCVHGFFGHSSNLNYIENQLKLLSTLKTPDQMEYENVIVKNSTINHLHNTLDGIDVCGTRLAQEMVNYFTIYFNNIDSIDATATNGDAYENENDKEREKENALSIVGYSMGGLISRYAIGYLHFKGYLKEINLLNFVTFATPHLGSRRLTSHLYGFLFNWCTPKLCSKTGEQLLLVDHEVDAKKKKESQPLLLRMALKEGPFYQGLKRFKYLGLYANVINDRTVSYCSASISLSNPYRHSKLIPVDKKYPHILEDKSRTTEPKREQNKKGFVQQMQVFGSTLLFFLLFLPFVPVVLLALFSLFLIGLYSRFKRNEEEELAFHYEDNAASRRDDDNDDDNDDEQNIITDNTEIGKGNGNGNDIRNVDDIIDDSSSLDLDSDSILKKIKGISENGHYSRHEHEHQIRTRLAIIQNLNNLHWKKFAVHIKGLNSHGPIIVRNMKTAPPPFLSKFIENGSDVVQHFIENFCT